MQRIELILKPEKTKRKINPVRLTPYLHGILMEEIDTDYATQLHNKSLNPYSMHVFPLGENFCWQVNLLTKEAIREIGTILLDHTFTYFYMESLDELKFNIIEKKISNRSATDLADIFYSHAPSHLLEIKFDSSTSFKQAGDYVFHPDLRLIFQSILMRYHHFFEEGKAIDEEILEEIISAVQITSYQLHSSYYPLHNIRLPAFRGGIRIRIKGNDTLKNYILMLLKFAEYSGIGIKTSLGMGSIRVINRREKK